MGRSAILIDNGFYQRNTGSHLAGEDAWVHTGMSYTESMSSVGTAKDTVGVHFGPASSLTAHVPPAPPLPLPPRRIWLLLMLLYVVVDDGYPVVQASFGMELLLWVASVASQPENAQRTLVGHGGSGNAETFTFGLAKYMLVTRSMADVSLVLFRILC